MSRAADKHRPAERRRYLVHLLCISPYDGEPRHYLSRIRPWAARSRAQAHERVFADDCELIAAVNPLLPPGSDVRDVFEHIDRASGFFYLLNLSSEEAGRLGWQA